MTQQEKRRQEWMNAEEQKYEQALFVFKATERTPIEEIEETYLSLMKRAETEMEFTDQLQQGYTLALNIVIEFRTRPEYKEK